MGPTAGNARHQSLIPSSDHSSHRLSRTLGAHPVRAECPDWVLVWNDRHLHRALTACLAHYNGDPPHPGART